MKEPLNAHLYAIYELARATKKYITENNQNSKYPHHPVNIVFFLPARLATQARIT